MAKTSAEEAVEIINTIVERYLISIDEGSLNEEQWISNTILGTLGYMPKYPELYQCCRELVMTKGIYYGAKGILARFVKRHYLQEYEMDTEILKSEVEFLVEIFD